MSGFNLLDILDEQDLPLKNRMNENGFYAPHSGGNGDGTVYLSPAVRPKARHQDVKLIPEEPLREGEQFRFHFDMTRCVGCNCCVVACNEQNGNPADVNWRRVGEIEGGVYPDTRRYHLSMACNHCLDPSCMTGCPTEAYIKLDNGIVKHRADECIGCGYCSWNCPYGVPQFNKERNIVTKCDMCYGRLQDGQLPACVAACPEGAIQIEKVNVAQWRQDHAQAEAPGVPDSSMTVSTTRITLPPDVPRDMLKGNRHRIEPEKAHTSLVIMTVLTQLAAGGFWTLWAGNLLGRFVDFLKPLQNFIAFGSAGMLAVTGLALFAAVFHLGRPLYAFKAVRGWRRSWLSREVILFALFSKAGGLYAALLLAKALLGWNIPEALLVPLGALVALLGFAGVYASARIYLVPARPAWNSIRTPLRFFLTGFMLGPAFALVVYSFYVATQSAESVNSYFTGPAMAFLFLCVFNGALQLTVLLSRLFHLIDDKSDELHQSTYLLIHRLRTLFLTRVALLVTGSFILPLAIIYGLSFDGFPVARFCVLSFIAFAVSIAGELCGRYLFFVSVVPKNMPGSFFTRNGGAH